MSLRSPVRRFVVPALVATIVTCTDAPTGVSNGAGVSRAELSAIESRVTLIPSQPRAGGAVQIQSVITNRGAEPVMVSSRTCGLDYDGNLELAYPHGSAACGGYSTKGPLAPGESRTNTDFNRIISAPGVYTLRVRHALEPELWVEVRVAVRLY